jgi:hypothetical protein
MALGKGKGYPAARFIVWSAAGACILFGIFGILMHDMLISIGITNVSMYGWITLGIGLALYLVEGIFFYFRTKG